MIKNPVTRPLTESEASRLKFNKRLQVVAGRLLAIADERGELRQVLDKLREAESDDQRSET